MTSTTDTNSATGTSSATDTNSPTGTSGTTGPTGARGGTTAWEGLVTAALLGTDRRTPPAEIMAPGQDAPAALLDAAALHTVTVDLVCRFVLPGDRREGLLETLVHGTEGVA
ncbi:hypothetical protein ACWGDX_38755, partial [Streptomyces sp. NPDC055025]